MNRARRRKPCHAATRNGTSKEHFTQGICLTWQDGDVCPVTKQWWDSFALPLSFRQLILIRRSSVQWDLVLEMYKFTGKFTSLRLNKIACCKLSKCN